VGWLPFVFYDRASYGYTIDNNLITGPAKNILNQNLLDLES